MEFLRSHSLDPNVLIVGRVLLSPGPWWGEQFPDDVSRRDDGTVANMFVQVRYPPSMSSDKYRELSKKAMTAFIHHMEEKWGDNIVGYQPGNGFGGEWLMFNSFWESATPPTKFGVEDYSPLPTPAPKMAPAKNTARTKSSARPHFRPSSSPALVTTDPPGKLIHLHSNTARYDSKITFTGSGGTGTPIICKNKQEVYGEA